MLPASYVNFFPSLMQCEQYNSLLFSKSDLVLFCTWISDTQVMRLQYELSCAHIRPMCHQKNQYFLHVGRGESARETTDIVRASIKLL